MKTRHLIAALAATFLVLFQGCQTSESLASSGDRSSEGTGMLAFRLSQKSLDLLRSEGTSFQIAVGGPGMISDTTYQSIDTLVLLNHIPCGTRYVNVSVIDSAGYPSWSGRDTVEVDPQQYAWAHITLRRVIPKTGNIVIDIDLDDGSIDTTHPPRMDTTWYDSLVNYPVDSTPFCYQVPEYVNDSATIYCRRLVCRPFPPIDTTWYDSTTYGYLDTTYTICAGFPWFAPREFRCARITETPYPTDTLWIDSTLYRDGFSPECRVWDSANVTRMICTRFLYQIPTDTVWQDTTVHTESLGGKTWCHAPIWPNDPHTYCTTGRYLSFAQDTAFLRERESWYGTRNLCEDIEWFDGHPYATVRECNKKR